MDPDEQIFSEYGDAGDIAGAHRSRMAFRLSIVSACLLTFAAYVSDLGLRHTQAERNFLIGVTHNRDNSRVFLRSAIRMDTEDSDVPTPKYTQALAVRQEDDAALEDYARGHEMDPTNSLFTVRYGVRAYLLGHPRQAEDLFVEASDLPPESVLPIYLRAAAVARQERDTKALREAMILVSRANNTPDPLVFPRPIWPRAYPDTGTQYAVLLREIFTETTAPLYRLSQDVVLAVRDTPELRRGQDARTWLTQLELLGRRLVMDSEPPGTLPAIAGVSIQLQAANRLRELVSDSVSTTEEIASLNERIETLEAAQDRLTEFEASRDGRIAEVNWAHWQPMLHSAQTIALLVLVYFLARFVHIILRYKKTAWTLPHSTLGKWVMGLSATTYFILLWSAILVRISPIETLLPYGGVVSGAWWGVTVVAVLFGLIYPSITLPSPQQVSKSAGRLEDMTEALRRARSAYRRVYIAFVVRYYGVLVGLFLCVFCVWSLLFRVLHDLYPWQVNLLTSGLLNEERQLVGEIVEMLARHPI